MGSEVTRTYRTLRECTSTGSVSYGIVQPGKHVEDGVPIVRVNNINDGTLDVADPLKVDPAIDEKHRKTRLEGGEVLLSLVGTTGQCVVAGPELKGWNVARAIAVIKPAEGIDADWLTICLKSPETQHYLDSRANTTVQKTLNLSDVREIPILTVPDDEERYILEWWNTLNDKIELNRRMNATLEGMAQALFKSWFVDFDPVIDNALAAGNPIPDELAPRAEVRKNALANGTTQQSSVDHPTLSDFQSLFPAAFQFTEELGWIPEGWEAKPFGSLLAGTIGGDWGKEAEDEKHTRSAVIIRGTDMPHIQAGNRSSAPERWVEPKKFATRELQDSDIVIEISGGSSTQSTGRSLYITDSTLKRLGGSVVPASFCRRFRPIDRYHGLYGALHLALIYRQGKMWEYQNQSTGISNFQTTSFLEREFVAYPSNTELFEELYRRVRPLVDKSTSNQQELLAKLRDTLLPKLISGELRLSEVEPLTE